MLAVLAYTGGMLAGTAVSSAAVYSVLKQKNSYKGYSGSNQLLPQQKTQKSGIPSLAEMVGM